MCLTIFPIFSCTWNVSQLIHFFKESVPCNSENGTKLTKTHSGLSIAWPCCHSVDPITSNLGPSQIGVLAGSGTRGSRGHGRNSWDVRQAGLAPVSAAADLLCYVTQDPSHSDLWLSYLMDVPSSPGGMWKGQPETNVTGTEDSVIVQNVVPKEVTGIKFYSMNHRTQLIWEITPILLMGKISWERALQGSLQSQAGYHPTVWSQCNPPDWKWRKADYRSSEHKRLHLEPIIHWFQ